MTHYGYIYMTTNLVNGKQYIGRHKYNGSNKDCSYIGSGKFLKQAIIKYGKENFSCRILQWCKSDWELNTREKAWILMYDAVKDNNFYNCVEGGIINPMEGKKHTKESKEKMSKSLIGMFSGSKNHMYGKKGKDNPNYGLKRSEETKEKISKALKGKSKSEETIKKISLVMKGAQGGSNNNNSKLTEEQVLDIYNSKGKINQKELARKYNVSISCISHIQTGITWNEVTNHIKYQK